MASIQLNDSHHTKQITLLHYEEPASLAQSLLDIYLPPGSRVQLPHFGSEGEELDGPALHMWNEKFQWPGDKEKTRVDVSLQSVETGSARYLIVGIQATSLDGGLFDIVRHLECRLDGSLDFRRERTLLPESLRGNGYGTGLIEREMTWVRERSRYPESTISILATRLGNPPGQFVWRKFFDFANEDTQSFISGKYSAWVDSNVAKWAYAAKVPEADLREILPATMEHPWSLDQCELPPLLMSHFKKKAEKEGYRGNALVAWYFWNSDGLSGGHTDSKGLGWEGIRVVNKSWHGPQ